MPHPQLILASSSPARREILRNAGLVFHTVPASVDERRLEARFVRRGASAADIALGLAQAKAEDVSSSHPDDLVIGADQILLCEETRLSKVRAMPAAIRRLGFLSGKYHHLVTAVTLMRDKVSLFNYVDNASLLMRRLEKAEIAAVLNKEGEIVLGSVGCYRLEGPSIQLFEKIDGDHYAMLGLPLLPLIAALRQHAPHLLVGASLK